MLINISDVSFFFKNEMIISFKYIFTSIDDKTTFRRLKNSSSRTEPTTTEREVRRNKTVK